MKIRLLSSFLILFFFLPLAAQTTPLQHLDVILLGPKNTDRHHPVQLDYYSEYYDILIEEIDVWLKETNSELKVIKKRNKKRLRRKKSIKRKDYPKWKHNKKLAQGLKSDRELIEIYRHKWIDFFKKTDIVLPKFMAIYKDTLCIDLITPEIVLSPKEYSVQPYLPSNELFEWQEILPKTIQNEEIIIKTNQQYCPQSYLWNGNSCNKKLHIETSIPIPKTIIIINLLNHLPTKIDGWREIPCK